MAENKVTFELTHDQKNKLKEEAGIEVDTLTYDALEDRIAPNIFRLGAFGGKGGPIRPIRDLPGHE